MTSLSRVHSLVSEDLDLNGWGYCHGSTPLHRCTLFVRMSLVVRLRFGPPLLRTSPSSQVRLGELRRCLRLCCSHYFGTLSFLVLLLCALASAAACRHGFSSCVAFLQQSRYIAQVIEEILVRLVIIHGPY